MPPQQTKPSTPRLSEVARQVKVPPSAVSTGWPAVRDKLGDLGIRFRWWQVAIATIILSKTADGKYATTIGGTGLSIPRQVGKTFMVGAIIFALCLLRPGLTVVWSAHRLRTAEETFKKMQALTRRKSVKAHILKVVLGSGEEEIQFVNGSRILFGARAAGFGRGFDEVDVVVYDEAQILEQAALDDMIPATNQCRQETGALLLFMGTPPQPKDRAEVFTLMRESALKGDDTTAWIEFGADEGYVPTASPAPLTERDWEQVARSNPSFPDDTPRESILRMRKQLGDESFRREGMGIWDKITRQFSPLNGPLWSESVDIGPRDTEKPDALGVDMSHDRQISIGACWSVEDDAAHVEEVWAGVDEPGAVEWIVQRAGRRMTVVIDGQSPAASMIPALKARKVKVHTGSAGDMAKACGLVKSDLEARRLTHAGQEAVDEAREGARKRAIGGAGGWGYDRRDPSVYIHPLVAVTLARLGASMTKTKRSESERTGRVSATR